MKTERNILIAFILNLSFSVFEFFGGLFTRSTAIMSDSVHDMGDALSIALAYVFERKSKKHANSKYTYGYLRYSVLGSVITNMVLAVGSVFVIASAISRIVNPVKINYDGMIIFAVVGVTVNFIAAKITHKGDSLNQKSVSLHMLEDVLGWVVVLVGAVVMRFTDISILDPIMSICVALFILFNVMKNMKKVLDIFLLKTPKEVDMEKLSADIMSVEDVLGVHHIHIFSIDGANNYATMHVVTDAESQSVKSEIKSLLKKYHIVCSTIELETSQHSCEYEECHVRDFHKHSCGHHHAH
ncbi:MAG: cation diffusion facilitator family transporter [Eubacteriales bacterium]|nr:cation diffusion facilitator family transporter [Eubacteriales bacterium]